MYRIYAGENLIYEPGDQELAVFSPKLTLEMGKAGSLEFNTAPGHPYNNALKQISTVVSVTDDDEEIFRGRVLSGSRTFYNQRNVYCEGDLSYLVDSVQKAEKYSGTSGSLFRQIIQNHNSRMGGTKQFTVGTISSSLSGRDVKITGQDDTSPTESDDYDYKQIALNSIVDNWNTTFDYLETCLLNYCGGYLMTRREGGTTYIDWFEDYNENATGDTPEIIFGENLLDLSDEISADDLFTVLIPLGDENLTIKDASSGTVDGIYHASGSDELVNEAAVAEYGRIVKTNVFSNVTEASTLLANGRQYMKTQMKQPQTITITAVDLHFVNPDIAPIRLGDRVKILSEPHDLNGVYMTCSKIEYDLENPANTVYTFGREKQTLTEQYRENKRKQSDTYGNSGGGAGAASVAHAANWENITEEYLAGIGSVKDGLKNHAGIDIDDPAGTINIYADHTQYVNDREVFSTNLGINLDAPAGTINIFTTAATADEADAKTASIILWAGQDEYGHLGSNIALNADLVSVSNRLSAVEGVFTSITGTTAYISKTVSGNTFYGSNFIISSSDPSISETNLVTHRHNILSNNQGELYLSGPIPLSSVTPYDIGIVTTPVFGS